MSVARIVQQCGGGSEFDGKASDGGIENFDVVIKDKIPPSRGANAELSVT